jgi:hypothetical protein
MTTVGILIAVAVLIGVFSYFTNAGLGDRRPKPKPEEKKRGQGSEGEAAPPPSK